MGSEMCIRDSIKSPKGAITYTFDVEVLNGGPRVKKEPEAATPEQAGQVGRTSGHSDGEDAN